MGLHHLCSKEVDEVRSLNVEVDNNSFQAQAFQIEQYLGEKISERGWNLWLICNRRDFVEFITT